MELEVQPSPRGEFLVFKYYKISKQAKSRTIYIQLLRLKRKLISQDKFLYSSISRKIEFFPILIGIPPVA